MSEPAAHLLLSSHPGQCLVPGQAARELGGRDAALLAWLAVEGPTARARLAQLLWPDSDAEAGRNALRQRLFQLRRQLGRELATGAITLALADGVTHDLAEADTLLGDAQPEAHEDFGRWLAGERERRGARRVGRWVAASEAAESARDYDAALQHARQVLAAEPLSEVAHRRVMRLHYLRGDRAAALLAFDECERMLKHEVGARPDAQTMALLAMVESASPAAPPAPLRSLPPGVLRPPRLVGRAEAQRQLLAAVQQGQHVLLLAEAGLGKTRLLEEAAAALAAGGAAVAQAGARPGDAGRPFALLARLLQALVPQPAVLEEAQRSVLAWVQPAFGTPPPGALQVGPFEAAVTALLAGRGVLLLDDLHYADAASIELLLRAATEPAARRWVMAVRPAEMPEALRQWRDAAPVGLQPAELSLATLDEAGIATLLDSLAVDGLSGATLAPALARHTGGNPQFVLETVKALLLADGGALGPRNAQAFASGQLPLPRTVGRLIHQRLRQLSPGALKLARLAAVAGQDLSPQLASHVLALSVLDLADPWAELEAAGVLRGNAFAHDLVSEGTLETMPQVLAATLHDAVAQWLAAHDGEAARTAAHLQAAGKPRDAVPWLLQAAAHASARVQLRDAARFCEQAAAICREHGDVAGELDALEAAVDALFDVDLGERMLRLLERLQTMPLADAARARALCAVAAVRHFRQEDDEALALGQQALGLAQASGQHALELRIRYGLVQVACDRRDLAAAEALIGPARALFGAQADALQQLQLACMEAWYLLAAERFEAARAAWIEVERQAAVLRRPRDQAMALNHLQVTLSLMGRFAEGHEAGLREQAIVRQHGLSGTRNIYLDMNLSISALLLGRYREAVEALQRARKAGVLDEATWHLRQAALQLQLGQPARCLAELRPLLEGRVQGPRTVLFNAVMVRLRWLEAHVAQGADTPTDARAHRADVEHGLAQAEALAAQTGRAEHRVRLQLMRGRLGPAEAAVPLLRQALDEARANHLRALEAALHAALARALQALQRPEDARAHVDSALALRDAGHVVDQMPGVELDAWAVELLADADPPRAAALLAAALAWVDRTAATEVDEAQRHGFLHAHPAHRRLRALAHDLRLAPHLPGAADAAAAAAPGALSSARAGLAGQSGP